MSALCARRATGDGVSDEEGAFCVANGGTLVGREEVGEAMVTFVGVELASSVY